MLSFDLLNLIPNPLVCRELKLLYRSNRLVEYFAFDIHTYNDKVNSMALTKFERMFVSWAVKKYWRTSKRDRMKQEMIEYAITGGVNPERAENITPIERAKGAPNGAYSGGSLSNVALFGVEHVTKSNIKELSQGSKTTNP